jgi:glycosyltransferase involved in cell wall biosynthesis
VLFFGYIRKYKGLDLLFEAMDIVRKSMEIHLLVAGEFYDDEQYYRGIVEQRGLGNCVHFLSEYIPNDRVSIIFSAVDCVVLPYRSATQSGIVQIAYNFNKPVIVTNVGGLAETVEDGISGFVVPPESPEALADSIEAFYRENREDTFVAGVKIEKAKYSWESLTAAIETLSRES